MKLVTVEEMRAIESEANEKGISYERMMENAGTGLADYLISAYCQVEPKNVLGLIGPGNNGGDTLIALARMANEEWQVTAYITKVRSKKDEPLLHFQQAGGKVIQADDDPKYVALREELSHSRLILDGVLGTGIKLPLKPEIAALLAEAKQAISEIEDQPVTIAVDCPSGVDCDSGEASPETLPADETICMAAVKQGLLRFPAMGLIGEVRVVDIGLPENLESWNKSNRVVVDANMVKEMLPERCADSHKGTFGTALIVAGSANYTGAVILSGEAAYRIGTGLVTLAVPFPLHQALAGALPEATWLLLPHELGVIAGNALEVLIKNLGRATSLLIGPGLGMEQTTETFISRLVHAHKPKARPMVGFVPSDRVHEDELEFELPPLVIDADALKLLAKIPDWFSRLPDDAILTPHPGEMSVLTKMETKDIQADRIGCAEQYAREWKKVIVLKGAGTVIAAPDGRTAVIPIATAALAKAGTGDVLSGLIVGLRAQGVDAYSAAAAGTWLHAQAGLEALEQIGNSASVLAGDVAMAIPDVLNKLEIDEF